MKKYSYELRVMPIEYRNTMQLCVFKVGDKYVEKYMHIRESEEDKKHGIVTFELMIPYQVSTLLKEQVNEN